MNINDKRFSVCIKYQNPAKEMEKIQVLKQTNAIGLIDSELCYHANHVSLHIDLVGK